MKKKKSVTLIDIDMFEGKGLKVKIGKNQLFTVVAVTLVLFASKLSGELDLSWWLVFIGPIFLFVFCALVLLVWLIAGLLDDSL